MNRLAVVNGVVNTMTDEDFKYGDLDCCLFAALVAQDISGHDYAAEFNYDSEDEAAQIIAAHGGLEGLLTALLGEPTTNTPRPGDTVLLDLDEPTVGVWYMRNPIVRGPKRFYEVSGSRAVRVWAID